MGSTPVLGCRRGWLGADGVVWLCHRWNQRYPTSLYDDVTRNFYNITRSFRYITSPLISRNISLQPHPTIPQMFPHVICSLVSPVSHRSLLNTHVITVTVWSLPDVMETVESTALEASRNNIKVVTLKTFPCQCFQFFHVNLSSSRSPCPLRWQYSDVYGNISVYLLAQQPPGRRASIANLKNTNSYS